MGWQAACCSLQSSISTESVQVVEPVMSQGTWPATCCTVVTAFHSENVTVNAGTVCNGPVLSGSLSAGDPGATSLDHTDRLGAEPRRLSVHSHSQGTPWTSSQLADKTRSLETSGLLKEFALGELLGHGSFSIVLNCRARRDSDAAAAAGPLAAKLIERVDARPEDIEQETQIHVKLHHPNILRVHRIFTEKCFVCMVLDLCKGGSLASLLGKLHRQVRRPLVARRMVHVGRQMVQAVDYIHNLFITHRDIKADNFLADRHDIADPDCRVVLADFGFAVECRLGDRLKRQCGTLGYWSPEVWDKNYALKADVWAVGVTTFGLVENSMPFKSEWDVKSKEVACNRVVSPTLAAFIKLLLTKQEGERPSASQALAHPWLHPLRTITSEDSLEDDDVETSVRPSHDLLQPELVDPGATERRLELVERMVNTTAVLDREGSRDISSASFDSDAATPLSVLAKPCFSVLDKRAGKTRTFEWWPTEKQEKHGVCRLPEESGEDDEPITTSSRLSTVGVRTQILANLLNDFDIDTSRFGEGDAKTLERFAEEVDNGYSQLMLDAAKHKALVRLVEVVLIRLCVVRPGNDERFLVVSADAQPDGRMRDDLNRLPGTKKQPHENSRIAAARILQDIPHMADAVVNFDYNHAEVFEVEEESPSYPGVRTVYRKEIIVGIVRSCSMAAFEDSCSQSFRGRSTKFFSWLTEEECFSRDVKLTAPFVGQEISSLVAPPVGLKVDALGRFLAAHNVEVSAFGVGGAKSLQELSDELMRGESTLASLPGGKLARLVDVVLLRITQNRSNRALVVAWETSVDGSASVTGKRPRLPGTKRRPHESQFRAAKRVLERQLNVSENQVNFDKDGAYIVEEEKDSPSYPGLNTIYRKRIILGYLDLMAMSVRSERSVVRPDSIPEESMSRRPSQASRMTSLFGWVSHSSSTRSPTTAMMQAVRRGWSNMGRAVANRRERTNNPR